MKRILITLVTILALSGCASNDYRIYADNQAAISTAKYAAISKIAESNPNAAAFAILGQGNGSSDQMRAPESAGETVLRYLGVLAAPVAQMYGAHQSTKLGIAQSDNSMTLGIAQSGNAMATAASTNNAFVSMAGKIQAPVTVVPQANVTTTLSGAGVIGSGSYSTNANPVTTTTTTNTTTANRNCTGSGASSGSTAGTTTPSTGSGGSGSANC